MGQITSKADNESEEKQTPEKQFEDMKEPSPLGDDDNVLMMDIKRKALKNLNSVLQKQISDKKYKLNNLDNQLNEKINKINILEKKINDLKTECYQKEEILSEYNYNMQRKHGRKLSKSIS